MNPPRLLAAIAIAGFILAMAARYEEASASHEDAERIEATLHPLSTLFPDASGRATFVRADGGWTFTVSITGGEPETTESVLFIELTTSPVGTPQPVPGDSFDLCTIATDTTGSGECTGELAELPEPAELSVFLEMHEGILLGAFWNAGDFTFTTEEPTDTQTPDLPETGTGPHETGRSVVPLALLAAAAIGLAFGGGVVASAAGAARRK